MATHTTRVPPTIPPIGEDDALIDVRGVCILIGMSDSWFYEEVRTGRAPTPVIRKPRCTRWRAGDIRAYRKRLIEPSDQDGELAAAVTARAKAASEAAQAKRRASQ